MSDIFREVDDEVRQQKLEAFWKSYGSLVIAAALALVLAVAGWRFYQTKQMQEASRNGEQFQSALDMIKAGKTQEASAVLTALSQDGTADYKILAQFRLAAEVAKSDPTTSIKTYDALANNAATDKIMQDLAKIRAASLLVDTAPADEILARIGGLVSATNPWRNAAREIIGLARFKAGDIAAATGYFEQIVFDPAAPQTMRERAELILGMARGGIVASQVGGQVGSK